MKVLSSVANLILPATAALSGLTLAIGVCACPLQSATMQETFNVLSAFVFVGFIVSILRHSVRREPYKRRIHYEFGVLPLLIFWGFLAMTHHEVREASARTMTVINGKQIGFAARWFDDSHKRMPADIRDPAGEALLSWRVNICPYIEAPLLHQKFKFAQRWDSPANRHLVDEMPLMFQSTIFHETAGHTPWQGFAGPETAFEPGKELRFIERDFPDGTSNTILIVEAQQHVPWSKPTDIAYGPNVPLPPLGQQYLQRGVWPFCCPVRDRPAFFACMADGTVRQFAANTPEHVLRAMIERNDGGPKEIPD